MRVSAYVLTVLNIIGWTGFVVLGMDLSLDLAHRAAGYPNRAQIIYYVGFPAFMVLVAFGLPAWRFLRRAEIGPWSPLLMLCLMVFYLMAYTGGI